MKRAAIYMRVSTARQAEEGDSIPAQREALMKYAQEHHYILVGEYLDDGISGTKDERDEFQRMLSDVRSGKIDLILITKLDRIHRSLRNFLNMQDVLDKYHCDWLAIWEPMYDSSTPQGRMIINTMMNLAQFEAEQTGQRIRQVFEYKRSLGEVTNGNIAFGYSVKDKHLVPNEDADKVRQIFQYYLDYGNLSQTRIFAHSIGYDRSQIAIKYFLRNRTYIGERNGVSGFCEPVVDRTVFDEVQSRLTVNVRNAAKRTYLFSGLLICDECGHRMSALMVNGRAVYRCHYRYGNIKTCQNAKILAEKKLEQYLLERIKDRLSDEIALIKSLQTVEVDNTKIIRQLKKKLERLKDLYIDGEIDKTVYSDRKAKYQAEINRLTPKETPRLEALKEIYEKDLDKEYEPLDPENRRKFWRSFVKEIRVNKERKIAVYFLD